MLILYCGLRYDYNNPDQGLSFEHYNFYESLAQMGHELIYFDFGSLDKDLGREAMNRRLLEIVHSEKPALLFSCLFANEFSEETIRKISENSDTITLNWFTDDHWRFDFFSRHWAPCFNWVVTTAKSALPKYRRIGYRNVIKSQWACNHSRYRKLDLPKEYDVTFVGQPHGDRKEVIKALRDSGIDVQVWGTGWETGRLSQDEMIRVFNQSRINLNLSNSSFRPYKHRFMRWKNWQKPKDQIKGRNFELPGCGAFTLTGTAENLEDYYADGKEIATFKSTGELIEKTRHYLARDDQRSAIAAAGLERTLREHTYEKRFNEIFGRIGLSGSASN